MFAKCLSEDMNYLFSQDDQVTVDEFKQAIQNNCHGKTFTNFPTAFKTFISTMFKTIDVNGKLAAIAYTPRPPDIHSPTNTKEVIERLLHP